MKKENNGFTCVGCGKKILPAEKTTRNHCPYCFLSLHVDKDLPGDRESDCGAEMIPVEYFITNKGCKISYICVACGATHNNKACSDDQIVNLDQSIQKWKLRRKHILL